MKKERKLFYKYINELVYRYPILNGKKEEILNAISIICKAYSNKNKLLICGNGGSASDAQHIVGELMKSFVMPRRVEPTCFECIFSDSEEILLNLQGALPAISLTTETSLISAWLNDCDPNYVYAQQVNGYGNKGDILIALSTSGNSPNIVYACKVAKMKEMEVIAMTGESGGLLKQIADITINVPATNIHNIQELHLPVYHTICLAVENIMFS